MRRWWHGPLAAVLLVWLVADMAEPVSLRACPLHDAIVGQEALAPGRASHDQHSQHGAAHGGHAPRPGHGAGPHARHGCTCLGECCATAPFAAPVLGVAITAAVVVAPPRPRPAPPPIVRRTTPEHARPPSVGPPPLHFG